MEAVVCHSFTLCHVLSFMTYRSHRRFLVFHCCCHCNCSMTLLYIPLSLRSASTLHTCPACTQLFGCSASPNILNSAGLSLRWCCSRQCCLVLLFTCLCYVWLSPDCECFSSFLCSLIRAGVAHFTSFCDGGCCGLSVIPCCLSLFMTIHRRLLVPCHCSLCRRCTPAVDALTHLSTSPN